LTSLANISFSRWTVFQQGEKRAGRKLCVTLQLRMRDTTHNPAPLISSAPVQLSASLLTLCLFQAFILPSVVPFRFQVTRWD